MDRTTRGKTRPGRLSHLDAWLRRAEAPLLARTDGAFAQAVFVDLGFGEYPYTTQESAEAFWQVNPGLRVIGVDRDPRRVELATPHSTQQMLFRQGGFALPLSRDEPARLIRAMNVLRQYPEEAVEAAHDRLGAYLLPGGLLVEGTCSKTGHVLAAHLLRRHQAGLSREGLLMHTTFETGFAPIMFRDQLPRDLRRKVVDGEPIHALFEAWTAAWQGVRARGARDPSAVFAASVRALAERVEGVDDDAWLLERGYMVWRPGPPAPDAN